MSTVTDTEAAIWNVLIAFDQAWGSALLGTKDLTISSRVGMALSDHECGTYSAGDPHGIPEAEMLLLANCLNSLQKNHCMEAWSGDRDRANAVLALLAPYLQRAYAKGITA